MTSSAAAGDLYFEGTGTLPLTEELASIPKPLKRRCDPYSTGPNLPKRKDRRGRKLAPIETYQRTQQLTLDRLSLKRRRRRRGPQKSVERKRAGGRVSLPSLRGRTSAFESKKLGKRRRAHDSSKHTLRSAQEDVLQASKTIPTSFLMHRRPDIVKERGLSTLLAYVRRANKNATNVAFSVWKQASADAALKEERRSSPPYRNLTPSFA